MTRSRRFLPLAGLLVAELAAVWLLHQLGGEPWARVAWDALPAWLASAGAVDALMAALRLVALAVGWWLLATTLLTAAAALAGADGLAGWVRPLTWSIVRAAVDRCVAAGVSAALVVPAAPALAARDPLPPPGLGEPPAVEPRDAEPRDAESRDAEPGPPSRAAPGSDAGAPSPDASAPASDAGGSRRDGAGSGRDGLAAGRPDRCWPPAGWHEVAPGEHLWGIAAQHLGQQRETSPAALDRDDLAAYWLAVVQANRDRLRSDDPDLIHPGERIRLPPA